MWLVYYGYQEVQAKRVVQLYYILLAFTDKDRLYKEFKKSNLKICILISFNVLAYSTNIPNIKHTIQYCMYRDKHINII